MSFTQLKILTLQLVAALAAGYGCTALKMPVGWLVGALLVGIIYALTHSKPQPLPPILATSGQIIVALVTATRFSPDTLKMATHYAFPMLLSISITGGMSLFNGYLLWRWAGIDRATGILGCIPGLGPSIVAMSEEMGADAIGVAVLQNLRIFLVVLLIPFLVSLVSSYDVDFSAIAGTMSLSSFSPPNPLSWVILPLCGILGVFFARQLKFPSPVFFGPFLLGLGLFWTFPSLAYIPQSVFTAGFVLIGLSIGLKFNRQAAQKLIKAVFIEIGLVAVLIIICLGVGYQFHLLTHVDATTSVLGTTPGGLSTVMATVVELGGDSGLVLAMQMMRMLIIILLTPWLAASVIQNENNS